MTFIITVLITIFLLVLIILDISNKFNITNKSVMRVLIVFIPHIVILLYLLLQNYLSNKTWGFWKYIILADNIIFVLFLLLKTNIIACSDKQKVELRLRILSGGRQLLIFSLYTGLAQILFYFISLKIIKFDAVPKYILIPDTIITLLCIVVFYINGMLRIIFVSKRINIIKKVIIVSIMFIPFINILAIIYICSAAKSEYEHECYRVVSHNMRVDSQTCKTKFPIVLIHGLGFKDYKYINYWGRIPKELIRNGATIYYGNQEAWGTIEYNAQDVKDKILQIVRETGCEKVNIIAHSKGGLDARYMISKLGMEDYVATLTMIAVPNQGSRIIDFIYILPKWFYGTAGKFIDKYFRLIGDKNPDFFTASRQLSTYHSKKFNEEIADSKKVYYQSYAVIMKNFLSDYILSIPYIILRIMGGENDGLVEIESAKWGEFRGTLTNRYNRGISHGDIIDLRKDSYKGFDVRDRYIEIVAELKDKGY